MHHKILNNRLQTSIQHNIVTQLRMLLTFRFFEMCKCFLFVYAFFYLFSTTFYPPFLSLIASLTLWVLMISISNLRVESEVPCLMSPLHISSKKFKKEKHGLSVAKSTNSNKTTEVNRRPPMPLPSSITSSDTKHHPLTYPEQR